MSRYNLRSKKGIKMADKEIKENNEGEQSGKVTMADIQSILDGIAQIKVICDQNKKEIGQLRECYQKPNDDESESNGDEEENIIRGNDVFEAAEPMTLKKIYDLPPFSGEMEQWPLFYANYMDTTRMFGYGNRENLMRLQKCLSGIARETVSSMLIYPRDVPNAISELKHRFGRSELLAREQLLKLQELPSFGESRMDQMVSFATKIRNSVALMVSADCEQYLADTLTLEQLVRKIPPSKQYEWVKYAETIEPYPTIHSFAEWISTIARVVALLPPPANTKKSVPSTSKSNVVMHMSDGTQQARKCYKCNGEHKISACEEFDKADVASRWEFVKSQNLCFSCLNKGHSVAMCRSKKPCGINGCNRNHNPKLHEEKPSTTDSQNEAQHILSCRTTESSSQLFKILPVTLCGPKRCIETYAIFDDGSAISLIEESVANNLGLTGPNRSITLQWFGDKVTKEKSRQVSLEIFGDSPTQRYALKNVKTVKNLSLPVQTFIKEDFTHLKDLPLTNYINEKPVILLGLDNAHLEIPDEIAGDGNPVAARTKLGWVAFGSGVTERNPIILHIKQQADDDELHRLVEDYFQTENFGTNNLHTELMSEENAKAREILETTTKRIGNQFETGLLWKQSKPIMPNSFEMAKNRLMSIDKKMSRDKEFAQRYNREMSKYFEKDYAKILTDEEKAEKSNVKWYLPHFAVTSVHKPEKCRIVFDAAARVDGISLNSQLMKGPEQVKPLLHILFKFRLYPIGVAADIREMFSQVKICSQDQNAQRFLWMEESSKKILHCKMTSMIFGAACSPCSAEFVKNKNAEEFRDKYPQAVTAIVEQHYVDDLVASFASEKEAVTQCQQMVKIHTHAGFELRNFVSNSETVQSSMNGKQPISSHLVNMEYQAPAEKVLGMYWNTQEDVFEYRTKFHQVPADVVTGSRVPTKREMLSITMSVYDPFGCVADFLLLSKILIKETWKCQLEWDDPIPDYIHEKWNKWWNEFAEVKNLKIPRCYSPEFGSARNVELHVMVDASESAFAAAAYLRIVNENSTEVCFAMGKTRNAPKRLLSIPRLELQAAILGIRVSRLIQESNALNISRIIYWSDSQTVLLWVNSANRKYKAFVGHRITEILEYSQPCQWRWVPTNLNCADAATRPTDPPKFDVNGKWLCGPTFLIDDESKWPIMKLQAPERVEEEIFPVFLSQASLSILNFKVFSSFLRLKRLVAWVMRITRKRDERVYTETSQFTITITREKRIVELKVNNLRASELMDAERIICRVVQLENYAEEVRLLQMGKLIPKSSPIYKLSPYLDDAGLLRLSGRIDEASCLPFDVRRPILMPSDHDVTKLIVRHYHEKYHHQNSAVVINEVRQKYWIPHIKIMLRKIQRDCSTCELKRAQPKPPQMGQLPPDRVIPVVRPFTYTGVDLFGPINVTIGRRHEKRWVAVFTCLTVRAVHLEIVEDLSTDAFLLCLRNFVNRRGIPVRIRCDNGTNFVGAQKELKQHERLLDVDRIVNTTANGHIEWVFNCPANPSSGGCWERLIRIIKLLLRHTLREVAPRVATLQSVLIEAENIVNSRPLVEVPLMSEDEDPITPNHFLIGLPNSTQTPYPYDDKICLKKQWLIAQNLKNRWWKRWTNEYLPQLLNRVKWHSKTHPIQVGDIVLVCDSTLPRSQWYKGRVTQVFPNKDGQVRIVEVKTPSGILRRPATKLAVLNFSKSG